MTVELDDFTIRSDRRATHRALLRDTAGKRAVSPSPRRAITFAVCAIALAIAAPALAIITFGPPWDTNTTSPEQAASETGTPVDPKIETTVDGIKWSFFAYRAADGGLCTAVGSTATDPDTPTLAYGCQGPLVSGSLFRQGPLYLYGPGESRTSGSSSNRWDHLWLYGLAKPGVARVVVRLSGCIEQQASIARNAFEGAGMFAYSESQDLLHRGVVPKAVVAEDAEGQVVASQSVSPIQIPTGQQPIPAAHGCSH